MYKQYIEQLVNLLYKVEFYENDKKIEDSDQAFDEICEKFRRHREKRSHVFIIGNGGSAGIAQHMTVDFLKSAGLRTISLYNQANVTCLGNDISYEAVFSQQIEWLAEPGDLLIAISSSGNSQNIVNAINVMRKIGGEVVTLTGFRHDNLCKQLGDINIYVPMEHYGMVESIHNLLLQQIVDALGEEC